MSNDIAIGITNVPMGSGVPVKRAPAHLITLEKNNGKVFLVERFISLDRPEALNGFINVKGFFSDSSEGEIIKSFSDLLTSYPKELLLEMMFPLHRVISIRNLIFNAVKTVNKK